MWPVCPYAPSQAIPAPRTPLPTLARARPRTCTKESGMPPVADRHATPAATADRAPRRRRRTEPNPYAAAALQRALDRRDNGGATGH
ncbi:hypothetical protein GCM10023235_49560 [Kitasatospora terrestris]|uniref:Uncharacterized protein n=2 Tax=Kitasatospora terrestris TaxID=258051 RepID=A0ABP9E620_9ACTN